MTYRTTQHIRRETAVPVTTSTTLTRRALTVLATLALLLVLPLPAEPVAQAAGIAVPVRVRMDLDTRNLYLYQNSATATTRLKDAAVSGVNANTWLDLSNAANNVATSKTSYCLAVNNNGYTVYVNQNGPVVSCANQTPISRVLIGEARTLTAPTSPALSFSNVTPTIGTSITASESGSNISRREWIIPEGSAQTTATTSGITYNSTGARSISLRAVGTKGERIVSSSVAPVGFNVTVQVESTPGLVGGNSSWIAPVPAPYMGGCSSNSGAAGEAGQPGNVVTGTYAVTSLPLVMTASLGTSRTGGAGGGSQTPNGTGGCWGTFLGGTGGSSGLSAAVSAAGTTIASAAGGQGGRGGDALYLWIHAWTTVMWAYGGAGSAQGSNSSPGLTGVSTSTTSNTTPRVTVTLPNSTSRSTTTNGGTITINSTTSLS